MLKISEIQMDMAFADPEVNFEKAKKLIREAAETGCDVVTLPETWNTGFFPKEDLSEKADDDCSRLTEEMSSLAKELGINIVAGSVANKREGKVFNTCRIFDRTGAVIGEYDKTHLFTPMGEHEYFEKGSRLCRYKLDGVSCGVIICYDIRFSELVRTLALDGLDILFVVSQWPDIRMPHLETLARARAIENQMFVAVTNSCGKAPGTVYGGGSVIFDPWGECLAHAGTDEEIISAECDLSILDGIRSSINVFRDRRPELYNVNK